MHVLVTGGSGFIGSALVRHLSARGHSVTVLSRGNPTVAGADQVVKTLTDVSGVDAVINLAGASLAGSRWTAAYKRELLDSRLETTRDLVSWMAAQDAAPATLISASAIGYYGHGEAPVSEEDGPGEGFSADLCARWEAVAREAEASGCRVCLARLGVVLDLPGGALEEMVRPFRFGVANWVSPGSQWMSWVHRADVVSALDFLLNREDLSGPFNITSPGALTARDLCRALQVHFRTLPALPVPGFVMRAALGEMADELLIHGQRVVPARLTEAGFAFSYPAIENALQDILQG